MIVLTPRQHGHWTDYYTPGYVACEQQSGPSSHVLYATFPGSEQAAGQYIAAGSPTALAAFLTFLHKPTAVEWSAEGDERGRVVGKSGKFLDSPGNVT